MTSRRKSLKVLYCVVAENTVVKNLDGNNKDSLTLMMGSLVHVVNKISGFDFVVKVVSFGGTYDESYESYQWICPADRLLPVNETLWPLLEAIPSPFDRVNILKNKTLCKELCSIDIGSLVHVLCLGGSKLYAPETAVVKYKGPVAKKGHGTYFGVELLETESADGCNGTFAGQQYFSCPPGTGKFVTINELRLASPLNPSTPSPPPPPPHIHMVSRHSATQTWADDKSMRSNTTDSQNTDSGGVPLKPGDQVVWVTDTGQDRGIVRWLQWSDDGQLKVGVYFKL